MHMHASIVQRTTVGFAFIEALSRFLNKYVSMYVLKYIHFQTVCCVLKDLKDSMARFHSRINVTIVPNI